MMDTRVLSKDEIETAAELLRSGALVAFPTETVYGLGAPLFSSSIREIFHVKGRPSDNPLIAHVHCVSAVEKIAIDIPEEYYRLAVVFSPGPLTVVLKAHSSIPREVSAGLPTVAVRIPSHPVAQELLKAMNTPLVAPSANLSGRPSSTCVEHVLEDFQGKIAAVIDGGASSIGLESTVISLQDAHSPLLLRPGTITKEQIEEVLKREVVLPLSTTPVASPGMKYRHYAPKATVKLFNSRSELERHATTHSAAKSIILAKEQFPGILCAQFPLNSSSLYAFLRLSDRMECDELLILCTEEVQRDIALMNRLERAAECPHGILI